MPDAMTFPKTLDEYMEQYKIVDAEQVYTNGTELVPIFRIKQWEDAHQQKTGKKFIEIVAEYLTSCPYPKYEGKPYFSIRYEENGEKFEGFGTYNPEVLSQYLKDYFIPSVQPEIIRCKDCKFYSPNNGGDCTRSGGLEYLITADEYCSKGEQK